MKAKSIIVAFSIIVSISALCAPQQIAKKPIARESPGVVELKGSQKGFIALDNKQKKMTADDFAAVVAVIEKQTKCKVVVGSAEGAGVSVEIIDDDHAPILSAYPEDHRAIVNVRRLSEGLKGDALNKFLSLRYQREVLRAFCYACGAGGSGYPDNILAISRISDLDLIKGLFIPGDAADACVKHMKAVGVTPLRIVPYGLACREGVAPEPTNKIQRIIWERVHALPTKPIKIQPETKPVKE